jgi:cephalosporin hydroxylase
MVNNNMENKEIVSQFHQLYYNSAVWATNTKWMGIPAQKCPLDLWVYQELIFELKPDLIIETGTCFGGSALFMAQMCELIDCGGVLTIDIAARENLPKHLRLNYLTGSSIDPTIVSFIAGYVFTTRPYKKTEKTIMVILDSDHSMDYVLKEMECYAQFITKGSYLIVEDSDVNGHPIMPDHGPGPAEAITEFLKTHPEFEVDLSREKFMMTQNPGGYLRRSNSP